MCVSWLIFVNSDLEYLCHPEALLVFDINWLADFLIFRADIARVLRFPSFNQLPTAEQTALQIIIFIRWCSLIPVWPPGNNYFHRYLWHGWHHMADKEIILFPHSGWQSCFLALWAWWSPCWVFFFHKAQSFPFIIKANSTLPFHLGDSSSSATKVLGRPFPKAAARLIHTGLLSHF